MKNKKRLEYIGESGDFFTRGRIYESYDIGSEGRKEAIDDDGNPHIILDKIGGDKFMRDNFKYV